ncbi:MAG: tRNA pseudouridine(55) synthase TruB [Planctomycetaceae bacterium]|nr:tRNA pseudouridine(55) synthase TruB [Planctomycetaceae bacterium]
MMIENTPAPGLFNLHKPAGMSSRRAVDHVKHLVKPLKAGHAGTLDPLASGVLVVAVGSVTRLITRIQQQPKSYRAVFRLGWTSPTDDTEADLVQTHDASLPSARAVRAALSSFTGQIDQLPPAFSAVHVGGQRAYKLARSGREVELQPKQVEIYRCELVQHRLPDSPDITVEIQCGSGTYIRSIGRDLGERLGCGAVMLSLVRTEIGSFQLDTAISPEELSRDNLAEHCLPATTALPEVPQLLLTQAETAEIKHGRPLTLPVADDRLEVLQTAEATATTAADGLEVAVMAAEGGVAALASWDGAKRVLRPRQVLIRPDSNRQQGRPRTRPRQPQ